MNKMNTLIQYLKPMAQICSACHEEFAFPVEMQMTYIDNNWIPPRRCPCCRDAGIFAGGVRLFPPVKVIQLCETVANELVEPPNDPPLSQEDTDEDWSVNTEDIGMMSAHDTKAMYEGMSTHETKGMYEGDMGMMSAYEVTDAMYEQLSNVADKMVENLGLPSIHSCIVCNTVFRTDLDVKTCCEKCDRKACGEDTYIACIMCGQNCVNGDYAVFCSRECMLSH